MITKKKPGALFLPLLKWTAVPLLVFLLAALMTRNLVPAKQGSNGAQFPQTVAASLQKLDSGDRAGAVEGLARAGNMAPGNLAGQIALVGKLQALGEHKLAAETIERSLRTAPQERQTVRSYAGLCEYLLKHGDISNAKRILAGDLLARWPGALETAQLQGALALQGATGKEDLSAAAMQLQECVALDRGHVPSKLQLGIAYARLGELERAEPLLREVLEQRPSDVEALEQLGEVLRQQGRTVEATLVVEEHNRVAGLQERRKQLESRYLLKQLQPADLLELARIYGHLREFSKAAGMLRAYTRRQPEDADAQRELARVCLKIDDHEGARLASESADALDAARRP